MAAPGTAAPRRNVLERFRFYFMTPAAPDIGEIGLTIKPSRKTPLSFDVGVQGYTGKRKGVTGALRLGCAF